MNRSRTRIGQARAAIATAAAVLTLVLACVAFTTVASASDSPHVSASVASANCLTCHPVHTGPLPAPGNSTCAGCHGGGDASATNVVTGTVDSFGLRSGHALPTTTSVTARITGCTTCHDAHGVSAKKRGIPARVVNGVAVSSAGNALCLACHSVSTDWYGPGYPSTSAPTRDASGFPVAGAWPGPAVYASPSNPHRLIPESTQTVGASDPVRREQGDCQYCHGAHGGANEYDGLVATFTVPAQTTLSADQGTGDYAALCFRCHGGVVPSGFATAPADIRSFVTTADPAAGHRVVTGGGSLPVGSPLPCYECHAPMGSARGNASALSDGLGGSLETSDAAGVREFCFTCHSTSDTTLGWDSATATYTPVGVATVVGLPRSGAELHLTPGTGHGEADAQSCYECHGDSYATGGNNVHDPGDGTSSLQTASSGALASLVPTLTLSLDATASVTPGESVTPTASLLTSASVDASASVPSTDTTPPASVPTTDTTATVPVVLRREWLFAPANA